VTDFEAITGRNRIANAYFGLNLQERQFYDGNGEKSEKFTSPGSDIFFDCHFHQNLLIFFYQDEALKF
jgi:hypothetical protein